MDLAYLIRRAAREHPDAAALADRRTTATLAEELLAGNGAEAEVIRG